MAKHLLREIDNLKKRILTLGMDVEESVRLATQALEDKNYELANKVIEHDIVIDNMEVEVEEECLKILALHQPVATDLRFIIAAMKINNDLERIGDLAVNLAKRARYLSDKPTIEINIDFSGMAYKAKTMLAESLDSLVNLSEALAFKVIQDDEEMDEMNRGVNRRIHEAIKRNPDQVESLLKILSCARHLERIADHATNIAEDVIYMITGEIVRHRTEEGLSQ